jgi:hypothetical protein
MHFENMEPDDFMKRGFLLPEGCKDLTDTWKIKAQSPSKHQSAPSPSPVPCASPQIVGEVVIPEETTVEGLAALLHQTKFQIVADLMKLKVYLTIYQTPDYETIAKVARMYGYIAKRAA